MKEVGASQRGDLLRSLRAAQDRVIELAQLVRGVQIGNFET
jgi:hypothetical protein